MMAEATTRFRTIWREADRETVGIVDQTELPHALVRVRLETLADAARAIADMQVRGAPLIGATAAYGMALALRHDPSDDGVAKAHDTLFATRPTAINLAWALRRMVRVVAPLSHADRATAAFVEADRIAEEDVAINGAIGEHGLAVLRTIAAGKPAGEPVRILTHCNAGWLATVDWGTATAPIYKAQEAGIPLHVLVDETRPRNQGAALTAFELDLHQVPHAVIVDNAGGHFMQHGLVDVVIVGTDRTTRRGDVCNKIGTYLKALAAADAGIPFYVTLPSPTIDFSIVDGVREIPIEERSSREVTHIRGRREDGSVATVAITPPGSPALNPAFDVTPAHLVTGLITERGVIPADEAAIIAAFPERAGEGRQAAE